AMGIASAVLLFILPLVLQQSMLLGIGMLHGGSIERRRKNGGVDPMAIEAGTTATVLGKTLCHLVIYVLPTIYVLHYVPMMFGFPQHANVWHELIIAVPFLIACSFMGQTLQAVVNERESVFLLFVFSSVVFVFLVGASWPRYLLSTKWHAVANCVPSTWMCNAYVLMQSGGAQLHHVAHYWRMLWLLCAVLFAFAYCVERFVNRRRYRIWQERSAARPDALLRYDLIKNGIN
ncbi:MAG: ABC transporter permease, partial [Bacteroidales bacterium]|nr:ABC transporter permease [Bacteroidales bacterium]